MDAVHPAQTEYVHKFGIEGPTLAKKEYGIDKKTGTNFWRKLVAKVILTVKVAYIERNDTLVQIQS